MKSLLLGILLVGAFTMQGCVNNSGSGDGTVADILFGNKGDKGDKGDNGLSAYEIAVENGFEGTETEWLETLRGEAGVDGIDGLDGLSAYQLWVLAGNEGTEQDFLNSLKGEDGADGEDGVCIPCDDNDTEGPEEPTLPENIVRMTFTTSIQGLTSVKIGHFLDGAIILTEDANITTDEDNVSVIKYDMPISSNGSHSIGIQFDKE